MCVVFFMIQAQVIQKVVAAVAGLPTVLLVPPVAAEAAFIALGYGLAATLAVGLLLMSAAGGGCDPVVGTLSFASESAAGNASCIAEMMLCQHDGSICLHLLLFNLA